MKLDKSQLYFLSGFFWQEVTGIGIGFAPIEGAVATVQTGTAPFYFGGTIWWERDRFVGQMRDGHGPSDLYNIKLEGGIFSFRKLYTKDKDEALRSINYVLEHRGDGSWEGQYSLLSGIEGPVLCLLQSLEHQKIRDKGRHFQEKWVANGRRQ